MKQNASSFERDTMNLRVFQKMKKINNQKCSRENWKGLKTDPFCAKHVIFVTETSHVHVARTSRQNTKKKTLKKISKRFLQLEVPLARESRTEPQKSLCTPRNWTFHLRTSRQPEPQKAWKSNFWKIFYVFFMTEAFTRQWVASESQKISVMDSRA